MRQPVPSLMRQQLVQVGQHHQQVQVTFQLGMPRAKRFWCFHEFCGLSSCAVCFRGLKALLCQCWLWILGGVQFVFWILHLAWVASCNKQSCCGCIWVAIHHLTVDSWTFISHFCSVEVYMQISRIISLAVQNRQVSSYDVLAEVSRLRFSSPEPWQVSS